MEEKKTRKDKNGNIIDESNKNYHITFSDNFVTIIEVESYKRYNLLDNDYEDDDNNNSSPFIENYTPHKIEHFVNRDPRGGSMGKCIIL